MDNINVIYDKFKEVVKSNPDAPAIIENSGVITFRKLWEMAERIAGNFNDCDFAEIRAKSLGIILSHNSKMIAAILAVLKTGARYVPAEPDFPVGRIAYMMEESGADFIITERRFIDRVRKFRLKFIEELLETKGSDKTGFAETNAPDMTDFAETNSSDKTGFAETKVSPENPAYVLYTSGTTGRPKGVCVTNANVCHYARAFKNEFHPHPGDVMLQYSVCSFDIFVEEVFASLLNGAAVAIPEDSDKADTASLTKFIERHGVTIISGFPYLLSELNHLKELPKSLRLLISGGDVLRHIYIKDLPKHIDIYNTYGPSETTVCASYYKCNGVPPLSDGTYPIGKAVLGARIEILDDSGNHAPKGVIGEICILGDGVSLGYIGDHSKENEAFEKRDDGTVVYHSGDLGYVLSDGNIAFLHRKDSQIMIYGKRVEISEVEAMLYQCKGIRQAIVRAFRDETGLYYMVAYIVPASKNIKVSAIKKELAVNLTPFMIPEFFVTISAIPLNSNGKPDISLLPVVLKEGYGSEY